MVRAIEQPKNIGRDTLGNRILTTLLDHRASVRPDIIVYRRVKQDARCAEKPIRRSNPLYGGGVRTVATYRLFYDKQPIGPLTVRCG